MERAFELWVNIETRRALGVFRGPRESIDTTISIEAHLARASHARLLLAYCSSYARLLLVYYACAYGCTCMCPPLCVIPGSVRSLWGNANSRFSWPVLYYRAMVK